MNSPIFPHSAHPEPTVPVTGSTTGVLGLLFVCTSIDDLKVRVNHAFTYGNLEEKIIVTHDIITIPFKIIISILSGIALLSTAAQILSISIGIVLTPLALATCTLIFLVTSTIYLSMELIRSISILVQSVKFINKEQVGTTLQGIHLLESLLPQKTEERKLSLKNNTAFIRHLGENTFNKLWESPETHLIKKEQAVLTYTKLNGLYKNYLFNTPPAEQQNFVSRIGANAAKTFSERVQNIEQYDLKAIIKMEETELETFITQGELLLKMVNRQTQKVLKVHIFSIIVLFAAGICTFVSTHVIAISASILTIFITCFATALSIARSCATDGYIDNPGEGISSNLSIPKILSPTKEGERVWSIWRTIHDNNPHVRRFIKCLYIFGCFASLGILPLFDGAIFKSEWIKKARGDGENYALYSKYKTMFVPPLKSIPV